MTKAEVLGLTWDNVDLKSGVLRIDHQLHYYSVNGKYCFKAGSLKTDHANRVIPLSKEALTLLQNMKRNEYFNSINAGVEISGYKNFVFLNSRKNNVIIPRRFGDSLIAACKKYNKNEEKSAEKEGREPELLPIITPHILRHTACTRMAEAGIDIKVLQTVMGHKKADITMNIYNHVDLCRIKKEFEKVDSPEDEYMLM